MVESFYTINVGQNGTEPENKQSFDDNVNTLSYLVPQGLETILKEVKKSFLGFLSVKLPILETRRISSFILNV